MPGSRSMASPIQNSRVYPVAQRKASTGMSERWSTAAGRVRRTRRREST